MKAGDLCVREVRTAKPRDRVLEAARAMERQGVGTLVVVDAVDRPLGILTDRDVALRCVLGARHPERTHVEDVMSGPVAWVHESAALEAALAEMARLRVRRLAVIDERERLVGVLALDDVLCTTFDEDSAIGRVLRATL